jgi:NAD(P)-dependent dehydrogenase (short-subunit alcohol dehydrogenase family)
MNELRNRLAVITGGGTGISRELARRLAAEGCHLAICDVSADAMAETKALCEASTPPTQARITTHVADVSDEPQVLRFRDEVSAQHHTTSINLLFNNAGIGGGGSMFSQSRELWEKTFNICWGGVYFCTRAFLPMLVHSSEGHLINISSINGFWATLGPNVPHTAYSAAKFAVKGFTEALINDLRIHAPHVSCSLVMPGHIGTSLVSNSRKIQTNSQTTELTAAELLSARRQMAAAGIDEAGLTDDDIQQAQLERAARFVDSAPTTAGDAARIILEGVRAGQWRILIGDDAHELDRRVRQFPERAYDADFFNSFAADVDWRLTPHPQDPLRSVGVPGSNDAGQRPPMPLPGGRRETPNQFSACQHAPGLPQAERQQCQKSERRQ